MNDSVDILKGCSWKIAHVAKMLTNEPDFWDRFSGGDAVSKEPAIEAFNLYMRSVCAQILYEHRADIPHIACDENAHKDPQKIRCDVKAYRARIGKTMFRVLFGGARRMP